jgi:Asp-tRNA(Asn)/Glu-tRNA(Gln) amidotransferase A subunit family amidase
MISAGLGTQVIGSTVRPASYCGCIGLKVSVGALNRGGSFDGLSQSVTGVLAATLEDAWQVASEIARRAGGDPGYPGCCGGGRDQGSAGAVDAHQCLGIAIAMRASSAARCLTGLPKPKR